jgi:hypothetical protein
MTQHLIHPVPVKTDVMRIPAAGPDPANTLAYLKCEVPGVNGEAEQGNSTSADVEFRTEFKIDGYQQKSEDWYRENTIVSATAMLRLLRTPTDLIFTFAADGIDPFLAADGTLGFVCRIACRLDDEAVFFPNMEAAEMAVSVSAYVLCYEPRAETPPSGSQRGKWRLAPDRPLFAQHVARLAAASSSKSTFTPRPRRDGHERGCPPYPPR